MLIWTFFFPYWKSEFCLRVQDLPGDALYVIWVSHSFPPFSLAVNLFRVLVIMLLSLNSSYLLNNKNYSQKVYCWLDPNQRPVSRGSRNVTDVICDLDWMRFLFYKQFHSNPILFLDKLNILKSFQLSVLRYFPNKRNKSKPSLMLCLTGIPSR